jgi:hypothetical protein
MNASLPGILARTLTMPSAGAPPLIVAPEIVAPLAFAGSALIVVVTLVRTRVWSIERSWLPLMAGALLASPLGWLYYMWWMLPGTRPSRLLFESPLLWMPWAILFMLQPAGWLTLTLGSVYFWGLFALWLNRVCFDGMALEEAGHLAVREVSRAS